MIGRVIYKKIGRAVDLPADPVTQRIIGKVLLLSTVRGLRQPVQSIIGIGPVDRGAVDVFRMAFAVAEPVIQVIVLADDGGLALPVHQLLETVIGIVAVAGRDPAGQPLLHQPAAGVIAVADGAVIGRPNTGQPVGRIVEIARLIAMPVPDTFQQTARTEVISQRRPPAVNDRIDPVTGIVGDVIGNGYIAANLALGPGRLTQRIAGDGHIGGRIGAGEQLVPIVPGHGRGLVFGVSDLGDIVVDVVDKKSVPAQSVGRFQLPAKIVIDVTHLRGHHISPRVGPRGIGTAGSDLGEQTQQVVGVLGFASSSYVVIGIMSQIFPLVFLRQYVFRPKDGIVE